MGELQHNLMWLEMQLVEQLDVSTPHFNAHMHSSSSPIWQMFLPQEISKDFELTYGDLVGAFKESVQSQYPLLC